MWKAKKTLAQILGVFNKVMTELEDFVADAEDQILGHKEQIETLQKATETVSAEMARAKKVIAQIDGLIK